MKLQTHSARQYLQNSMLLTSSAGLGRLTLSVEFRSAGVSMAPSHDSYPDTIFGRINVVLMSSYRRSPKYRILSAATHLESSFVRRLQWYYQVPIDALDDLTACQAVSKGLVENVLALLGSWADSESGMSEELMETIARWSAKDRA